MSNQDISPPTAFWECASGGERRRMTSADCPGDLLHAWPLLPPHVKDAIFTLVDATLSQLKDGFIARR
jgi:hypothetical protein